MEALLNEIIPLSFVDGPGSRFALFFQGCQLRCAYCHNPETQGQCDHCGLCVDPCPNDALQWRGDQVIHRPDRCDRCDHCLRVCPASASPRVERVHLREVIARIARAAPFIHGVTCSGGECTDQHPFIAALSRQLRRELPQLSLLVDTHGCAPLSVYRELVPVVDGFIFDLKAGDAGVHRALTGRDGTEVLASLNYVASVGRLVEVRSVLVPGYTASPEQVVAMAHRMRALPRPAPWRLIPFRPQGVRGALSMQPALSPARYRSLCDIARGLLPDQVQVDATYADGA